jgi:hypothetical protein
MRDQVDVAHLQQQLAHMQLQMQQKDIMLQSQDRQLQMLQLQQHPNLMASSVPIVRGRSSGPNSSHQRGRSSGPRQRGQAPMSMDQYM